MTPRRQGARKVSLREDLFTDFRRPFGANLENAGHNVLRIERQIRKELAGLGSDVYPGTVLQKAEADILRGERVTRRNVLRWLAAIEESES